jgi:hypothetical protein
VAIFLFVITAFGLASHIAFFDRDSKMNTARSAWMFTFMAFNGMDGATDFVFANQANEPNSFGYAGFFFCVTTLIGNLILSNLVVNVLGARYTMACHELVKSKRKLQIDNFVRHGRHILLRKLYFRSENAQCCDYWPRFLSLPRPFIPWITNKYLAPIVLQMRFHKQIPTLS